jgi:hypothetical protein
VATTSERLEVAEIRRDLLAAIAADATRATNRWPRRR